MADYLANIGFPGSTDANIIGVFNRNIMQAYDLILAELEDWQTQVQTTARTAQGQQYYHMPPSAMTVSNATVRLGNIAYPLRIVESQQQWDLLNEILIQVTAIPQLLFPRRDDFGIWPIPQDTYFLTLNYNSRSPLILNAADYTTGTVTINEGSNVVTGSGTAFNSIMIGQWFNATGLNDAGWYRIVDVPDGVTLTLENAYEGPSASSLAYTVGQVPELPDEGHLLLSWYCASLYFAGLRKDIESAEWWTNMFWVGDGKQSKRDQIDFKGGMLGLKRRYAERSNSGVINRRGIRTGWSGRQWGYQILPG